MVKKCRMTVLRSLAIKSYYVITKKLRQNRKFRSRKYFFLDFGNMFWDYFLKCFNLHCRFPGYLNMVLIYQYWKSDWFVCLTVDDKKFICGYKKVTQNFLDYFLDASELKETICQSKWRCWLKCHFWLFWMFIIRLSIIKILIF